MWTKELKKKYSKTIKIANRSMHVRVNSRCQVPFFYTSCLSFGAPSLPPMILSTNSGYLNTSPLAPLPPIPFPKALLPVNSLIT